MRERLLSPFDKRSDYSHLYLYEWFSWNINMLQQKEREICSCFFPWEKKRNVITFLIKLSTYVTYYLSLYHTIFIWQNQKIQWLNYGMYVTFWLGMAHFYRQGPRKCIRWSSSRIIRGEILGVKLWTLWMTIRTTHLERVHYFMH
jgi:hypothetical protein